MAQVIFIEGVSGVGKSTMVKKLSTTLSERGYSVKSYVEFDYTNPIDFYCTAYVPKNIYEELCTKSSNDRYLFEQNAIHTKDAVLVRYYNCDTPLFEESILLQLREMEFCYNPIRLVPLYEYTAAYTDVWEQFVETIEDSEIDYYIFDGSLLHHPINDMMRNYHISSEDAANHVKSLLSTMKKIPWQVFYLYTKDFESQLKKAHVDRAQQPPSNQEIEFWNSRYQKDIYVLKHAVSQFHAFDISENSWEIAKESILSLL